MHILLFTDPWPVTARRLIRGIARYARAKADWQVEFLGPSDERTAELPAMRTGDGIIFKALWPELIPAITRLRIPTVFALASQLEARTLPPHVGLVTLDDRLIGSVGAQHLLQLGHRCLAFCGLDVWWSLEREQGFTTEAQRRGAQVVSNRGSEERGDAWVNSKAQITQWLTALPLPTAIMCCNDQVGAAVIRAAIEAGLRVPEDLAVLGVNDDDLVCDFSLTPLSSIDTNLEVLGYESAAQLDAILGGGPLPSPRLISSPKIIARRSTDTLAISDPEVAAAIRFIRAHAHEGIDTQQVVELLATSRSSLERRFRKVLGRTPGYEIRSARLAHAMQLLTETHMSISQIAMNSGYSDQPHFTREFTRFIGTPPLHYRRGQQRIPQ